jgi:hypothetical protein
MPALAGLRGRTMRPLGWAGGGGRRPRGLVGGGCGCGGVAVSEGGGGGGDGGGGDLGLEGVGVLLEALLLEAADGVAGELGGVEVSVRGEAAGAGEEVVEGLAGLDAVDAGGGELALELDELGLLRAGDADVGLGEDGDDVAGEEFDVLCGIVVDDGFGEVEGEERGGEVGGALALDDGVVPVDVGALRMTSLRAAKLLPLAVRAAPREFPPPLPLTPSRGAAVLAEGVAGAAAAGIWVGVWAEDWAEATPRAPSAWGAA